MNKQQNLWWQQAKSDHSILLLLRRNGVPACHNLHYLQMVTEKLGKAYFWRTGKAPSLAQDGPNPEYPWPSGAPEYAPVTHEFDIWRQLSNTGRGRQLLQVIQLAIEKFPLYG